MPHVNLTAIPTYCPRGFGSPDLWHALGKKHAPRSPQTRCITVEWTFSPLLSATKQWHRHRAQQSASSHLQHNHCQHIKPARRHLVPCKAPPGLLPCSRGWLGSPRVPSMSSPSFQAEGSLSTPAHRASSRHSLWRSHFNSVFITFFHASVTGSNTVHLQKAILFEDIRCHSCPPVSPNSAPLTQAVLPNSHCRNVCGAQASTLNRGWCPAHRAQHTLTHKSCAGIPAQAPKFIFLHVFFLLFGNECQ